MSNQLKYSTSPYLLQHAENPVNWYMWCDEAFETAKRENKPIFLSIGYSTCHWCHVMAHESFEDEKTAEILNKHFISIKVDREERPDIDSVYMAVCQAFTGSGGWPTSIFMTWDKKPFFAGTYFPVHSRYGMPGFSDLLMTIEEQWEKNQEKFLESADEIIAHLKNSNLNGKNNTSEYIVE
ncbi:MAG: thioredoxin domain-containing protein, partial [Ruminococcus sp.]|nr:thioredoxin domain-containing protein [Ruminococcus sp.]